MKNIAVVLVLVSLASNVMAGSSSLAQSAPPADHQVTLIFNPPLDAVFAKAKRYGHNVSTSVSIAYDKAGSVSSAKLDATSGDQRLDKAILEWAALTKANGAGSGKLPIKIQLDGGGMIR